MSRRSGRRGGQRHRRDRARVSSSPSSSKENPVSPPQRKLVVGGEKERPEPIVRSEIAGECAEAGLPDPTLLTLDKKWAIWCYAHWKDMKNLISLDNVADLWRCHHHLLRCCLWPPRTNLAVFPRGVRPEWEDEVNKKGGRWILMLEPDRTDEVLTHLLLLMVGNTVPSEFGVVGILLSLRMSGNRLSLWTTHCHQEGMEAFIRKSWAAQSHDHSQTGALTWEFKTHSESVEQHSAYASKPSLCFTLDDPKVNGGAVPT